MITVYYRKVFPFSEEDTFFLPIEKISQERREKLLQMKNTQARNRSLAASLLLHYALCEKLGLACESAEPFSMEYGENGKPYLPQWPGVHFNLSHSGDYVCCALGDEPVGVDIQKKMPGKEKIAERFFTPAERKLLAQCREEERQDLFFRMWSVKESYLKLTGEGIAGGLSDFEIGWEERTVTDKKGAKPEAHFEETGRVDGYSFCVCFWEPFKEIIWKVTE